MRSRNTSPAGLGDVEQADASGHRARPGRGSWVRSVTVRSPVGSSRILATTQQPHAWTTAGDRDRADRPVGPPGDDHREQTRRRRRRGRAGCRRGGTSAASRRRSASGTPSAMPPAPWTISLPGQLQLGVQLVEDLLARPAGVGEHPGVLRARRSGSRRSRAAAWGGAPCAGRRRTCGSAAPGRGPSGRRRSAVPHPGRSSPRSRPRARHGSRRATSTASDSSSPRRSRTRSCPDCRAQPDPRRPARRRRRCARRAAPPGRSSGWPGCPGRARCRRRSSRSLCVPGPLQMITGPTGIVVASTPWMLNSSVQIASTIVITHGRYSGLHPAITALIAIFSTVTSTRSGGTTATTSSGARVVPSSMRSTRSGGRRHDREAVGEAAVEQHLHLVVEVGDLDVPSLEHVAGEAGAQRVDEVRVDALGATPRSHHRQFGAEIGDAGYPLPVLAQPPDGALDLLAVRRCASASAPSRCRGAS